MISIASELHALSTQLEALSTLLDAIPSEEAWAKAILEHAPDANIARIKLRAQAIEKELAKKEAP